MPDSVETRLLALSGDEAIQIGNRTDQRILVALEDPVPGEIRQREERQPVRMRGQQPDCEAGKIPRAGARLRVIMAGGTDKAGGGHAKARGKRVHPLREGRLAA